MLSIINASFKVFGIIRKRWNIFSRGLYTAENFDRCVDIIDNKCVKITVISLIVRFWKINLKESRWSIGGDIAIFFNDYSNHPNDSKWRDKAWLKEALVSKRVTQFSSRSIFFYPWYFVYIRPVAIHAQREGRHRS